ncbi:hypothetical protein F2Q70_00008164 [Brassica cretica]|uniref:Uncharacterized protein n=1 Tax=Brassica cretica TaxID=69181 RepID=A0A8S9JHQ0_BRACR|nr:hypothetical protein F2Q68_00001195 [Brassica cretica]KAF2614658.1 hypothetical protein F2Q70_00008164 [Brassica cretica]
MLFSTEKDNKSGTGLGEPIRSLHFGRVRSVVLDRGNVDMTWLSKMEIIPPEVIETPHRKSCIARRGGECKKLTTVTQSVEEEKVYLTAAEEGMLLLLHEMEEKKRRWEEVRRWRWKWEKDGGSSETIG